jgi:hypothetical protein
LSVRAQLGFAAAEGSTASAGLEGSGLHVLKVWPLAARWGVLTEGGAPARPDAHRGSGGSALLAGPELDLRPRRAAPRSPPDRAPGRPADPVGAGGAVRRAGLAALALGLEGCAGVLDLGRATTLRPGEVQVGGGLAAVGGASDGVAGDASLSDAYLIAGAGVRGGVAPRVEVGGDVQLSGYPFGTHTAGSLDVKLELSTPGTGGWHLAVDPRVRVAAFRLGGGADGEPAFYGELSVIVGVDVGPHQLLAVPVVGMWSPFERGLYAALTLGASIRAGPIECIPGLTASRSIASEGFGLSAGLRFLVRLDRPDA